MAGDHILLSGGDFGDLVGEPGKESPDDRERLKEGETSTWGHR